MIIPLLYGLGIWVLLIILISALLTYTKHRDEKDEND